MKQYDVYLINLDPTIGAECQKIRPCVIISPDDINKYLKTVIIAPLTTKDHPYPTRVPVRLRGKDSFIVLDQMRTVDRRSLIKSWGAIPPGTIQQKKKKIKEILVD